MKSTAVIEITELQREAVRGPLEKFQRFARELEEFIKHHTIINRDDDERRCWELGLVDPFHLTCSLIRQNCYSKPPVIGKFEFVIALGALGSKMPTATEVVASLYPEFITGYEPDGRHEERRFAIAA